jgi:hypothetical protein
MSVPLDRLYNFLHDVCNHRDLIIYRFFPHGSKKIIDLLPINPKTIVPGGWNPNIFYMICHDQEPLDYDAYATSTVAEEFIAGNPHAVFKFSQPITQKEHIHLYSKLNLRMVVQNPVISMYSKKPVLLVHSEKNSQDLQRYEQQLNMTGVYWWSHAAIARDWFRYAEHDPSLDSRDVSHDFLVYNRAWTGTREYRLKFADLLIDHDLVLHCRTKFAAFDSGRHYCDHVFKNKTFEISRADLEQIFKPNLVDSTASADYVNHDYTSTQLEIVLETLFDDDRIQLTEKSLRPIACGHPFMLMSTPGSLEYLRSYGFETFGPHIDESYDAVLDPAERMRSIVAEMRRIASLSLDQKQQLYTELRLIAARNKQLFFSNSWYNNVIEEFKNNFDQASQVTVEIIKQDFWNPAAQS